MPQTVTVAELKSDIEHMPNEELMEKYGFAKKDLEVFLDTFVGARPSMAGLGIPEQP